MWYREARWKPRLVAERAAMMVRFPQFHLRQRLGGELFWEGVIEPQPEELFRVSITYPGTYPYREPELRVEDPPLRRGAPHVYLNGAICVHKHRWDPATGTAASLVPLVSGWLIGYVCWVKTGESF